MSKSRDLAKNLILLAIVLLVCFLILEFGVRIFWSEPGYAYPDDLFIPSDSLGYKYQPNFSGNFVSSSYSNALIQINSKGLRDKEYDYQKSSITRVLGLGDSVMFGPGLGNDEIYFSKLDSSLDDIEFINAGHNGYEFSQELTFYHEEGFKYDPDFVLIGVVLNDPRQVNISNVKELKFNSSSSFRSEISSICKSCKLAYRILTSLGSSSYNDLYFSRIYDLWQGESFVNYSSSLLEFNSELEDNDVPLILVVFPYTQQFENSDNLGKLPQELLKELADSQDNIYLIDLTPILDRPDWEQFYLLDDNVHLNFEGNALVADYLEIELAGIIHY